MGTKDILLETVAVSRRWTNLPKRTMTDQLTPVDKRVRLPLAVTLVLGTALAACARISSELPNTASPVVDNGPRVADVTPTNEVLGIQFNEVAVWDKATLATKDASISAQINALSREVEKQRPELFINGTQLDSFAISVPVKDMTGKKTNTLYPFIVGNNPTDRSKSFVTIVLRRADGQGIFAQSLTPMDILVDNQLRGALVLPTGEGDQLPVFVFPMTLKNWNAQNDTQKMSTDVIFIPPTGERVRIPMPGGKLASPAIYNAEAGYATPDVKPTATVTATNTPEPTSTPTTAPSKTPTPTPQPAPTAEKPKPSATPRPDNPNRLPGTPDIMPNGSYPTNNEKTDWSTPPMDNNPCEGLPDKFWFPPRTIKYDPNKNLPWGEVRYVCTYNTEYKGYVAGGKLIYEKKP